MPRTFSLARLMIGVTAVCLLCGFAVNYPSIACGIAIMGSLLIPTVLVWLVLCRRVSRRVDLTFMCAIGAVLGWLILAPICVCAVVSAVNALALPSYVASTPFFGLVVLGLPVAACPALGSFFFGCIVLHNDGNTGLPPDERPN